MKNKKDLNKKRRAAKYDEYVDGELNHPQILQGIEFETQDTPGEQKPEVIPQKQKVSTKKRVKRILKLSSRIVAGAIFTLFAVQGIKNYVVNHRLPPKEPDHTYDDYIDDNGNDFDVDDNGQIIVDQTTSEEKALLTSMFNSFILQDANTRNPDANISEISDILSISLVPFNLCPSTNEYDKYYVSLLCEDNKNDLFTLNYLTGKTFESQAELSKDFFTDFINYLSYDCALDSCQKMSEMGTEVKNIFGANNEFKDMLGSDVVFVGDPYLGYSQSSAEAFYIPVYGSNGLGTTFYSMASQYYDEDPMEKFYEGLSSYQSDFEFFSVPFEPSESFQKFLNLVHEYNSPMSPTNEGFEMGQE